MKRRLACFFVSVVTLSLIMGCGSTSPKKSSSPVKGNVTKNSVYKEYRNADHWSFNYPATWDKEHPDLIQQSSTGKTIMIHSALTTQKELDQWIQNEKKRKLAATEAENTILAESSTWDAKGRYINSYTINSKTDGSETVLKTTIVFDGKRKYIFSAEIPPVSEKEFDSIVNSLETNK